MFYRVDIVLQGVSVLHCVTGCYRVLHGVTRCSDSAAGCYSVLHYGTWCYMVLT